MFNRKKLDRERLEIYLVYLLLRVRVVIALSGFFLLVYAVCILAQAFFFASALILIATYLVSLALSFQVILWTARWGAWLVTWRHKL